MGADLTELDLSFAKVSLRGLGQITGALLEKENENIHTLSLRGIS